MKTFLLISLHFHSRKVEKFYNQFHEKIFNNIEEGSFHYWHDCLLKLAKSGDLKADILDINWYDVGIKDTLDFLNSE